MSRRRKRVIHVTESYGGGVAAAIGDYRKNYPDAEHHLIYAPRSDAPISPIDIGEFQSVSELPAGHFRRVLALRRQLTSGDAAIIHAHSSFAGAYVRAAIRKSLSRPIVYTPHCYGFERRDVSLGKRAAFWMLEWALAFNTNVFAGCSAREVGLSKWPLVRARRVLVPNVAASDLGELNQATRGGESIVVVGAGRLGPQKDPQYFRDCILAIRSEGVEVDARWIGGGDPDVEKMLRDSQISITGWLPRLQVLQEMQEADIYIHSALWEGFPVAVLESVALGVATLVRDIPAFDYLPNNIKVNHSLPDFIVNSMADLDNQRKWREDNISIWRSVLQDNHHESQAASLKIAYS